jgi:hypothetical protein
MGGLGKVANARTLARIVVTGVLLTLHLAANLEKLILSFTLSSAE